MAVLLRSQLGGGVMAGYGIYLLVEAKQSGGTISFVRVFGDHLEEIITEHENDNVLLTDTSITALNEMQKRGCAQAIYNEVKDSTLAMGIIILIIALIQIGAIICASCLAKKVNE
ncbi:hypothetical protein ACTXT7_007212 [Hymenolepis weldensis]